MYFPYKNEHVTFKLVEITIRKELSTVKRQKMEAKNKFRVQYICAWKCHNKTLYMAIINKNVSYNGILLSHEEE
jgi:hypothetical protein